MMDNLNINNSKKLIIGMSILFCTVILIIGTSLAFFTQSDTKEIGNIVTENINGSLLFDDNNDYMFGNFVPVNEEDVIKFASKTTDICKYQEGMYACNMYEFTITNDSNVAQELKITLNPTKNEFGNLYYMLFESNKENISSDMTSINKDKIVETNSNIMVDKLLLGSKQSKTYTIIYYVLNLKDTDQTSVDAGKQFYANVRVDSITTGTYTGTNTSTTVLDSKCYEYEQITEGDYVGTYKLTKFNGIDENGLADTTCGVTANGEFYSIEVPSKIKDEEGNELEISTLGNKLFSALILENENMIMNSNYFRIENITLNNGIKELEDGIYDEGVNMNGTFLGIGMNPEDDGVLTNPTITLPNTLNKIGKMSFFVNNLESIVIPKGVEIINDMAFFNSGILSEVTFEVDENGSSNLTTIGDNAFCSSSLKEVEIPYSVTYIGDFAFEVNSLEKVTFLGDLEDTTNPLVIGKRAFNANLNYATKDDPLVIPARVTSIGNIAFEANFSINNNLKFIKYMGNSEALANLGTNWYNLSYIEYIKSKDEY